jgi:hypothetical protein
MEGYMKKFRIVYISLFFIILAVPLVGLIWYQEPEGTENKILAEIPALVSEGNFNKEFLQDLEDYFSDHFAYRQELVTANAVISSRVFKESSEDLAIVGTDGWLYLKVSLDDYNGTRHMTKRGLHNVASSLRLMQEYVEGLGKKFVFACAPNKNTLYPEHMPYYYVKSEDAHDWELLMPYLDAAGISYVNLQSMFEAEDEVLYHKGDSHWNNLGAAMVQNEILSYIDVEHTDYSILDYDITDDFQGDIDKILYPLNRHKEVEYDFSKYMTYEFTDETNVEAAKLYTTCEGGNGRLLCFRDSFGNSLLQFMANDFSEACFVKSFPYHLDSMYYEDYDVCVLEIVERNLAYIKTFAPVMPAPLRSIDGDVDNYTSEITDCEYSDYEQYYKFEGTVDEAYVADDSPIYLRFSGDSAQYIVEATPVTQPDDETTQDETLAMDYGYIAYVSPLAFAEGEYDVDVVTYSEGWKSFATGVKVTFGQGIQ